MALEGPSSGERTAQEDEEMKDVNDQRNEDSSPMYLLCRSGEAFRSNTLSSLSVFCSAFVKGGLLTGSHG